MRRALPVVPVLLLGGCLQLDFMILGGDAKEAYELPLDLVPEANVEFVTFEAEDGTQLSGVWARQSPDADAPPIILFHGNGGAFDNHEWNRVELVWSWGEHDVFTFDYRGYGTSEGKTSFEGVFEQVQGEEADFGVVPIENSTQGVVSHTLDLFIESPLHICGEIELRIHHNLLTHARSLAAIERVYAHQQSLSQCKGWLKRNLPGVELIAVSSNADAAQRVRSAPESAAIAGLTAAEIYGLPVLFSSIEDQKDNTTRFLVIGRELFSPSGDDKSTLLLTGDEGPGLLHALLAPLARHGINMTRIESRPAPGGKWEYVFFVDVDGHAHSAPLDTALEEMRSAGGRCRLLGSYPRAVMARLPGQVEDNPA